MDTERMYTLLSRKLAGEATALELAELTELLQTSTAHLASAAVIEEYWNTAAEKDRDFLEATYHLHVTRMKAQGIDLSGNFSDEVKAGSNPFYKRKNVKKLLIGCTFIVITVLSFIFLRENKNKSIAYRVKNSIKNPQSEVSTKSGSRTKIQLPDGTIVWLNGGSKLVYDNDHFGGSIREVSLTGEGYFDVVKNPAKPFIIHTSKMDIKVLGTIFNVRCYPGEKNMETSLIKGSIEVTLKNRKDKIMLRPSEKLIIINEEITAPANSTAANKPADKKNQQDIITLRHLTVLPQDSTIVETAWVENRLVFSSETFEEVALKMEKWYGVEINFAADYLRKEPLTGIFKKETIGEALRALQLTTRFNFKINNNSITISK